MGFIATFAVSLRFLLSLDSQHQDKWKNLTWQNPEQQKVARELVKLMNQLSCGMREINMKNLIFVLLALSSLIMVSCANADSLVGSTTLFDYNRSNHQVVDSSFLSGLSVVELEQTPTGPVVEIDRMIEIDGNLCVFFQSQGKVAMFDGKGKFLREICRRGKGHGEYTQLVDVAYDKYNDEFLFLVAPSSIMRYSKTGIFKDKKELDKLYSEIAVDSSFIYLYNPTYTKDAKMDYTIECINKKNGERKQLLEMNEDYSPYSSVGFRMFATKQGVSFVRKFDNCIYDIKNGELKHLGAPDKPCGENVRMLTQKLSLNDTRLKKS